MTKSCGYVNFKSEDSVALALKLDGTEILQRSIRVRPCLTKFEREKKGMKRSRSSESEHSQKKFKDNSQKGVPRPVSKLFLIL